MIRFLVLGATISFITTGAAAQHTGHTHLAPGSVGDDAASDNDAFLAQAREASSEYERIEAAIAAGYRLIGPDFPGMGEHWVNLRMVVRDTVDPSRPSVLTYLRVAGDLVLTGVAYTLLIRPEQEPPEFPFKGAWHFHDGTVDDETLLLNPSAVHHSEETEEIRLGMLHAWIWVENPDGIFAQDNWALPFLRLGLPGPEYGAPQAGKALFLLTGGVDYYARLVEIAGAPDASQAELVREVLMDYHDHVSSAVAAGVVDSVTLARLSDLWLEMWKEIEHRVSEALWERIRSLAG